MHNHIQILDQKLHKICIQHTKWPHICMTRWQVHFVPNVIIIVAATTQNIKKRLND